MTKSKELTVGKIDITQRLGNQEQLSKFEPVSGPSAAELDAKSRELFGNKNLVKPSIRTGITVRVERNEAPHPEIVPLPERAPLAGNQSTKNR